MCITLAENGFTDMRTFEVLSRDYLIRKHQFPIANFQENWSDKKSKKSQIKAKWNAKKVEKSELETIGKKRSLEEVTKGEGNDGEEVVGRAFESGYTERMTSRPVGRTFGHTAYVTFARKPLPDKL